ncbi:MAG: sulfatase-like hydrolase/transferase [Lachnospiraceae bacterium]|nr:sulfatase-like hydrolase/transferase [Lachnospiraceae bacterium]
MNDLLNENPEGGSVRSLKSLREAENKRSRRRISRARREAFRRRKADTTVEYFHPLLYFVGLFIYLEMVFHRAQFPHGILFWLMLMPLAVAGFTAFLAHFIRMKIPEYLYPLCFGLFGILFFSEAFYNGLFFIVWLPLVVAAFFAIFPTFFSEKTNKIIGLVITCVLCTLFAAEVVYNGVFNSYFALFSIFSTAGQALDFLNLVFETIWKKIIPLLCLYVPVPVYIFFVWKRMSFRKKRFTVPIAYAMVGIVTFFLSLLFLKMTGNATEGPKDIYYNRINIDFEIEKLGVITTTRLDMKDFIFGGPNLSDALVIGGDDNPGLPPGMDTKPTQANPSNSTKTDPSNAASTDPSKTDPGDPTSGDPGESGSSPESDTQPTQPETPPVTYEPNILNIDFDYLNTLTTDPTIQNINTYFKNTAPTMKNEWTGKFKGYNVIVICAEGFWKYAIDKERTPTLYRLAHEEGFEFTHYYTPLWYGSTSGGEFATLTGLMPKNGGYVSLKKTGEDGTNMYMTLGRRLEALGYYDFAAHNNSYTYYGRNQSLPNMGYNFFATNSPFEWTLDGNPVMGYQPSLTKSGKAQWPQSDDRLIEQSFGLYCDREPFNVYYMTVSGHCNYTKVGNQMVYKNWDKVQDLPYQLEQSKGYIACHYELEAALTRLVNYLEEKNLADHTLIVLTGDHVPYNNKAECDEIAGHVLDENIEWFSNTLIMWTGSMKEKVVIDKYCTQTDILPTVMNLLGVDYDSRMMVGRDILSNASQLVIFKNGSFITDQCIYNGGTKQVETILRDDVPVDAAYLKAYRDYINAKWAISTMIIESNYYQFASPYFPK